MKGNFITRKTLQFFSWLDYLLSLCEGVDKLVRPDLKENYFETDKL